MFIAVLRDTIFVGNYITRDPPYDSDKNYHESDRRFLVCARFLLDKKTGKKGKISGLGF